LNISVTIFRYALEIAMENNLSPLQGSTHWVINPGLTPRAVSCRRSAAETKAPGPKNKSTGTKHNSTGTETQQYRD